MYYGNYGRAKYATKEAADMSHIKRSVDYVRKKKNWKRFKIAKGTKKIVQDDDVYFECEKHGKLTGV